MAQLQNCIIDARFIERIMHEMGWSSINQMTTIRQFNTLAHRLEEESGKKFIHMGVGNPGLPPAEPGVEAQVKAILDGCPATYPESGGTIRFRKAASQFISDFLNVNVNYANCMATIGSTQAAYLFMMALKFANKERDTMLFLCPDFPVHKMQAKVLGINTENLDISQCRGNALRDELEKLLKKGNIHSLIYSSPNNPTWQCLTDEELQIIGELANEYNVIVLEDLAYFGMDFRKDYSKPGVPPYQPTVGKYAEYFVLMISSSKVFSYPGERIGILAICDKLASLESPVLKKEWQQANLRDFIVYIGIAATTTSATYSAQEAIAAIMEALHNGTYNYRDNVLEYGRKAALMKKAFIDNGFYITYDKDCGDPIADGFYFTYCYPGFTGLELVLEMYKYGISGIPLSLCDSEREGVRCCCALIPIRQVETTLPERLAAFAEDHPVQVKKN